MKEKKLIMNNLNTIFLFLFIFSVLTVVRTVFRFVRTLSQNPPKPLEFGDRELIFLGITVSYCLTYIISA
jgi:hypothetical protein